MALIRGFTQVEEMEQGQRDGQMPIPSHIRRPAGLMPGGPVEFEVLRVKGTSRRPHLNLHTPDQLPIISPMEAVFLQGVTLMEQDGNLLLPEELLEVARLGAGQIVELKVAGPRELTWLVAHNRGKYHFLGRAPMNVDRKGEKRKKARKRWRTMPLDY